MFQLGCILILSIINLPATHAAWTGISASVEEVESSWNFENNQRHSDITRLNLQFEESTASGVGIGANIGRLTARISNISGPRDTVKFDTSYFGVYMRLPFQISDHFSVFNKLSYQYHSGSQIDLIGEDEIEWREISFQVGLSGRFGNLRVTPFAHISDVSGDISGESGTISFDNDEDISSGLSLDLFIEPGGFIRLQLIEGDQKSATLVFAREFN